ncbi:MAG TPA: hypothetical protein VIM34_16140 [Burkholderiaceae bacterium]
MVMLLLMWAQTLARAGTPLLLSAPGLELPIDMPPFHVTDEGTGSRKAGQKAGQSC